LSRTVPPRVSSLKALPNRTSARAHVLSGAIRSQVGDEPAKVYHAGDGFYVTGSVRMRATRSPPAYWRASRAATCGLTMAPGADRRHPIPEDRMRTGMPRVVTAPAKDAQVVTITPANEAKAVVLSCTHCGPAGTMSARVGRHGSMKPGGRRAGDVACHNTGFTTPTYARGRRSLGRQSPRTRGGLDPFDTHTQLAQYYRRYMAKPL
jgi:hypothetical protein